jgi:hypothetical protein
VAKEYYEVYCTVGGTLTTCRGLDHIRATGATTELQQLAEFKNLRLLKLFAAEPW